MASAAKASHQNELSDRVLDPLPSPYLLFLGETVEPGYAKTAFGIRDWAGNRCIGEVALRGATVTAGLPRLEPHEAVAKGAKSLLIGVASPGGSIPETWIPLLLDALCAGLDIVSGMHAKLNDIPELAAAARTLGRRLVDVRVPPANIPVGNGRKRPGKRLLTVGTDCALGKKYTALAISNGLQARGADTTFRATGQTGIMIAGAGIPIDAVVSDFIAGAAEILSPAAANDHIDVIEGQGSLFHPAYAAVSLGLLHGSQPDMFIVCHQPGRTHVLGYPGFLLPSVEEVIDQTIALGRLTNPSIRCVGISLNTAGLTADEAATLIQTESDRLGLPVADPIRGGSPFEHLLDSCLA
jgi:D-glutamate N-acetyltransferase